MKKSLIFLLLLALVLSGCGGKTQPEQTMPTDPVQTRPTQTQETEDPQKHRVELTLWVTEERIWAEEELLQELLASFADYYPNITVNVSHVSAGALKGQLPDLVLGDTADLKKLAEEGKLQNLDGIWQTIGDAYPGVANACSGEAGYFAMPLCVVADCMAIRLADFEAAEADMLINTTTHTWIGSNFLRAAANLAEAGKENPVSLYCKDTAGDTYTRLLVENFGSGRFVKTLNNTYQIESEAMTQALGSLSNAPGVVWRADLDAAGALEEFLAGKSAMVLNWNSSLQLEHGGGGIVYMLYPSSNRCHLYGKVYAAAVCATADARREAASMTLAAFLRDSGEAVRATQQLPARESGLGAYEGTSLETAMKDLSRLLSCLEEEVPGKNWEAARAEWVSLLQNLAEGNDLSESIEACRTALAK